MGEPLTQLPSDLTKSMTGPIFKTTLLPTIMFIIDYGLSPTMDKQTDILIYWQLLRTPLLFMSHKIRQLSKLSGPT